MLQKANEPRGDTSWAVLGGAWSMRDKSHTDTLSGGHLGTEFPPASLSASLLSTGLLFTTWWTIPAAGDQPEEERRRAERRACLCVLGTGSSRLPTHPPYCPVAGCPGSPGWPFWWQRLTNSADCFGHCLN